MNILSQHTLWRNVEELKSFCALCATSASAPSQIWSNTSKIIHYDGPMNVLSSEDCEFLRKHKSTLDRHKKGSIAQSEINIPNLK